MGIIPVALGVPLIVLTIPPGVVLVPALIALYGVVELGFGLFYAMLAFIPVVGTGLGRGREK